MNCIWIELYSNWVGEVYCVFSNHLYDCYCRAVVVSWGTPVHFGADHGSIPQADASADDGKEGAGHQTGAQPPWGPCKGMHTFSICSFIQRVGFHLQTCLLGGAEPGGTNMWDGPGDEKSSAGGWSALLLHSREARPARGENNWTKNSYKSSSTTTLSLYKSNTVIFFLCMYVKAFTVCSIFCLYIQRHLANSLTNLFESCFVHTSSKL